jgi:hypothetical protein
MIRFFSNTLDRVASLLCGVAFAQTPQFIQHYMQQLSGRVDELHRQVASMRYAASLTGKSLEQFIEKFQKSSDADFTHQGEVMAQIYNRYETLSSAFTHLQASQGVERPFTFFYYADIGLIKSTLANFSPGLPLTLEAGIYALIGVVCCHLTFSLIGRLIKAKTQKNQGKVSL